MKLKAGFQQNWIRLKPPAELPPSCIKPDYTQQRSDEWFKLRTELPVTGITVYVALGASSLKEQQKHLDKVKRDIVEHTVTPKEVKSMPLLLLLERFCLSITHLSLTWKTVGIECT